MRKILTLVLAIATLGLAARMQGLPKAADDDTLVYVDYDGSLMNKAQYLRTVADPTAKPEHMHDEGMKVHVYSSAGVVTGVYRETGTSKGKPYIRRARFTDTWIKQNGQWKCVASQSTLIQ